MAIQSLGRLLILFGAVLLVVGVIVLVAGKVPFLGRLPGDLVLRKNGLTVFLPIVAMLTISLALTLLLNLFFRLFR